MRPILFFIVLFLAATVKAQQPRYESRELTCRLIAIQHGYTFAYERLLVDNAGEQEYFIFYPSNGKVIKENLKEGQMINIRVTYDLRGKKALDKLASQNLSNKKTFWFVCRNLLDEIKIGNEWVKMKVPVESGSSSEGGAKIFQDLGASDKNGFKEFKVFLDQRVVGTYLEDDQVFAMIFPNGVVFYNQMLDRFFDSKKANKVGDIVSFVGNKMKKEEGYRYPLEPVNEVYYAMPLRKENGKLQSWLFKQNHVCIGVTFTTAGKDLRVCFPSDKAVSIREFLKPDKDLKIYYGPFSDLDKYNLPELHAIIQDKDTLFIKDFGFYGGPEVKHDHQSIEFRGKITGVTKTKKGNIEAVVINSEYYMEIDAMMAQQLGHMFERGKRVIVEGQERIKKIGEIYNKDYRIVTPEKITIDGITFSAYKK